MHPTLRYAAAAALVVALAGFGAAVLTRTADIGNRPFAGTGPLPQALQRSWRPVGARMGARGTSPSNYVFVSFDPTTVRIETKEAATSSASLVGRERFEVRATTMPDQWHCRVDDTGTYLFGLSAGDRHLTLTPVSDACPERAAILMGDWVPEDIGELPAGRYASTFRPFGGGESGRLAFTVPTGWADYDSFSATTFSLLKPASVPTGYDVGTSGGPGIVMLSDAAPTSRGQPNQAGGCTDLGAGVVRTPAAMAAWLRTLPGLVVTAPTPVSIGGLSGVMVDLSVDPAWQSPCPLGGTNVPLDTFTGTDPAGELVRLFGTGRARYILLDGGDGSFMVIDIQAPDEATWGAFLADAMQVVGSFEFTR